MVQIFFRVIRIGVSSGSTECTFYTMMSAEFSTYFLLFGLINVCVRQRKRMNSWMLGRDAIIVCILYLLLFFWVYLDAVDWSGILMFVTWFVFLILDSSNEKLMQLVNCQLPPLKKLDL
jgi:hypothetical protein